MWSANDVSSRLTSDTKRMRRATSDIEQTSDIERMQRATSDIEPTSTIERIPRPSL